MRNDLLKDILFGLAAVAIHFLLIRHLTFWGIQADLIWLFLLWICSQRSRTQVLFFAAAFAFIQDALLDLWGLNMFAKTLTIFIAYKFVKKSFEQQPLVWQVFLIAAVTTLLHNIILLLLSSLVQTYSAELVPVYHILAGNSIYTALVGSVIYAFKNS